jgi:hypothetical protein
MTLAQSVIPIGAALFIAAQLLSMPDVLAGRKPTDDEADIMDETPPEEAGGAPFPGVVDE